MISVCKVLSFTSFRFVNCFQGGYMNAKIEKLDKQGLPPKVSDIFKGVAIFVNGYTSM